MKNEMVKNARGEARLEVTGEAVYEERPGAGEPRSLLGKVVRAARRNFLEVAAAVGVYVFMGTTLIAIVLKVTSLMAELNGSQSFGLARTLPW